MAPAGYTHIAERREESAFLAPGGGEIPCLCEAREGRELRGERDPCTAALGSERPLRERGRGPGGIPVIGHVLAKLAHATLRKTSCVRSHLACCAKKGVRTSRFTGDVRTLLLRGGRASGHARRADPFFTAHGRDRCADGMSFFP
eukprot:3429497-Prymnesium_polylepis.1